MRTSIPMLSLLALCALPACSTPPPTAQVTPATQAAPFSVPMDPATIRCSALGNPAAMDAATDWALGRARAAVLSGRSAGVPDTLDMAAALSQFCQDNPSAVIGAGAASIGL